LKDRPITSSIYAAKIYTWKHAFVLDEASQSRAHAGSIKRITAERDPFEADLEDEHWRPDDTKQRRVLGV